MTHAFLSALELSAQQERTRQIELQVLLAALCAIHAPAAAPLRRCDRRRRYKHSKLQRRKRGLLVYATPPPPPIGKGSQMAQWDDVATTCRRSAKARRSGRQSRIAKSPSDEPRSATHICPGLGHICAGTRSHLPRTRPHLPRTRPHLPDKAMSANERNLATSAPGHTCRSYKSQLQRQLDGARTDALTERISVSTESGAGQ